jgi:hypothetical protein
MTVAPADDAKKIRFFDVVLAELAKVPFGTYTKKDLDCLLLHAFREAGIIDAGRLRGLANALGITEQRAKNLLLDIRYKYLPDTTGDNLQKIVADIFAARSTKVVHENGCYVFAIEDPVLKVDFEQGMKDVGYYSDTSFNKEIVKVRDYALIAFLFRMNNNDGTFAQLQAMTKAARADERDLMAKIQLQKTWLEIGRDLLSTAQHAYDKVSLLGKLAQFITTGKFA